MSLNLNKYGLEMQAAWKEVMNDDTDINWVQTRGRQFIKVVQLRTVVNRFWSQVDKGGGGGGSTPLWWLKSAPPPPLELKYTPPLWDGLNTHPPFLSLGKFF